MSQVQRDPQGSPSPALTGCLLLESTLVLAQEGQQTCKRWAYQAGFLHAAQRTCQNCFGLASLFIQHPKGQGKSQGLVPVRKPSPGLAGCRAQQAARSSPRYRHGSPPSCIRECVLTPSVETIPSSRWPHLQKYFGNGND